MIVKKWNFAARPSRERGRDGRRQEYPGNRRRQEYPGAILVYRLLASSISSPFSIPVPEMGAPQKSATQGLNRELNRVTHNTTHEPTAWVSLCSRFRLVLPPEITQQHICYRNLNACHRATCLPKAGKASAYFAPKFAHAVRQPITSATAACITGRTRGATMAETRAKKIAPSRTGLSDSASSSSTISSSLSMAL